MRGLIVLMAMAIAVASAVACSPVQEPVTTFRVEPSSPTTTSAASSTTSDPSTTSTTASTTSSSTTATTLPPLAGLSYEVVAEMPFPTNLTVRPGDDRLWVTTKDGRVRVIDADEPEVVLDLSSLIRNRGEQGLLGLAFHPTEPLAYLHYSAVDGDTVVIEVPVTEQGGLDGAGQRLLLRLDQPASNHNGGMLGFGPDGTLYVALGDGGAAADRFGNGQDTSTLLGGILRIDPVTGDPYGIPPDNPFVGEEGADELWAYGLRNPWRFWIDEELIYIADVGQNAFEEVNVVPLRPEAYNFGWPITEGLHCFSPSQGCDTDGLTLPVLEVAHGDAGTCSITGGVVYRGAEISELVGHYLYSDYCGGWLRSFRWAGEEVAEARDWTEQVGVVGQVVSFGVDAAGEVYVLTTEQVLRLRAVR